MTKCRPSAPAYRARFRVAAKVSVCTSIRVCCVEYSAMIRTGDGFSAASAHTSGAYRIVFAGNWTKGTCVHSRYGQDSLTTDPPNPCMHGTAHRRQATTRTIRDLHASPKPGMRSETHMRYSPSNPLPYENGPTVMGSLPRGCRRPVSTSAAALAVSSAWSYATRKASASPNVLTA